MDPHQQRKRRRRQKPLDELPDLAIAVDEPGARFRLAFGFREQACDEAQRGDRHDEGRAVAQTRRASREPGLAFEGGQHRQRGGGEIDEHVSRCLAERADEPVEEIAHAGFVAPTMECEGFDAGVSALSSEKPSPLIALAEASRLSIADALELGDGYDVLAVRSEFWGNEGDYRRWMQSALRNRLFERGGREVTLPRLRGWIVVDLDERHLSFAAGTRPAVLDYPDDEILSRWLVQARAALAAAGEFLGLETAVSL
jgi:hypothetical protein